MSDYSKRSPWAFIWPRRMNRASLLRAIAISSFAAMVTLFCTVPCRRPGSSMVNEDLTALARRSVSQPRPVLPSVVVMHRTRPHNVLQKFLDLRVIDRETAGIVLADPVRASIETHFALNDL